MKTSADLYQMVRDTREETLKAILILLNNNLGEYDLRENNQIFKDQFDNDIIFISDADGGYVRAEDGAGEIIEGRIDELEIDAMIHLVYILE